MNEVIVGKHTTKGRAEVYFCVSQVSYTVCQKNLLFFFFRIRFPTSAAGSSTTSAAGSSATSAAGGKTVPLHYARVSAYPINRRWPGHQRPLDQTELASFASFAVDGPVQVQLKPDRPFKEVAVRPISRNIRPQIRDGVIEFTLPSGGQYTVELDGFHNALHIFADDFKDFAIGRNDPQVRYFGPGLHDAGEIELHDNETLFLDEGAIVFGYVVANDARNIRILGHGILDGSKNKEKYLHEFNDEDRKLLEKGFAVMNVERRATVCLIQCDDLIIDGFVLF